MLYLWWMLNFDSKKKILIRLRTKKNTHRAKAKGKTGSKKFKANTIFQQNNPTKRLYVPKTLLQTQPGDIAVYQSWDDIVFGTPEPTRGFCPEDSCMGCLLSTCQRASYHVATAVCVANSLEGPKTAIMNNCVRQDWFISIYNGVKKVYSDSTYGIQCARMYAVKTWPTSTTVWILLNNSTRQNKRQNNRKLKLLAIFLAHFLRATVYL